MMTKGKQKLTKLLQNIKKLTPKRRKFWIAKIEAVRRKAAKKGGELGNEPQTGSTLNSVMEWAKGIYEKADATFDDITLGYVNELDKIYNGVANEVKSIPPAIGKVVGSTAGTLTGSFIDQASKHSSGTLTPFVIGAGAALAILLYLNPSFLRR